MDNIRLIDSIGKFLITSACLHSYVGVKRVATVTGAACRQPRIQWFSPTWSRFQKIAHYARQTKIKVCILTRTKKRRKNHQDESFGMCEEQLQKSCNKIILISYDHLNAGKKLTANALIGLKQNKKKPKKSQWKFIEPKRKKNGKYKEWKNKEKQK